MLYSSVMACLSNMSISVSYNSFNSILGWSRLPVMIHGYRYPRLPVVTHGYQWLPVVTHSYQWLLEVTHGYQWLPMVTSGY